MVYLDLPRTRAEAVALNSVAYFTGKPCVRGHVDKRYTNTKLCYACKRDTNSRRYASNPEAAAAVNQRSHQKNRQKRLEGMKEWQRKNREAYDNSRRVWALEHKDRVALSNQRYQHRKRNDPFWRLSKNTCKSIWDSLKRTKGGRHWESLVGFTLDELIQRLEVRFRDGMTWENYGSYWDLDHIKPVSICTSFEEAWVLTNLQPLTKAENNRKGNRYIG